ncbi:MAG TPA: hypothetical protein VHM20_06345, partial [Gammaproteobacteria bacterium]|nr:hypothetical protein [Gammaproteobacteria bacterium]
EARQFIFEKLKEDRQFKIVATYCLYEGMDILQEFSVADIPEETATSNEDQGSGQQKGSSQSFRPTPFGTTPTIGPKSYIRDEEDKDKEE